jgi:hypothetical protein
VFVLCRSQPPRALVATPMYAIALLPSAVEVKGISRAAAPTAEQVCPELDGCCGEGTVLFWGGNSSSSSSSSSSSKPANGRVGA